uniref:Uncharacterized protein n=1 Tax=Arundo donax TaxID=35708 RepID=A0A0A8Z2M3_ARUDO
MKLEETLRKISNLFNSKPRFPKSHKS